jgi:hypothetical protein
MTMVDEFEAKVRKMRRRIWKTLPEGQSWRKVRDAAEYLDKEY